MLQEKDYYAEKVNWFKNNNFEEISPLEYYRLIFPEGSFQKENESNGDYKPNGLLQFDRPDYKKDSMSCCVINDELKTIEDCIAEKGRFEDYKKVFISGCSYIGSQKTNKNARFCHAIIIDLDKVDSLNLANLLGLANEGIIPMPTALVVSGNGVHVVYALDNPIPLYSKKAELLMNLKAMLTRKIWNEKTSKDPNVQYQGIVQGYRAVGTKTKNGHIVKAFKTGKKVTIDELIETLTDIDVIPFLKPDKVLSNGKINKNIYSERIERFLNNKHFTEELLQELLSYSYTLSELEMLNPTWYKDWYQRRILNGEEPGHIDMGRLAYDKWLQKIKNEAKQGVRRRCIICLASFAQKCNIPKDEFINDAYSLIEPFNALTVDKKNPFTKEDVESVITQYKNRNYINMSIKTMERMTGITYPREKKNHRPDFYETIKKYVEANPTVTNKAQIARECGCTRPTVYKYLNSTDSTSSYVN